MQVSPYSNENFHNTFYLKPWPHENGSCQQTNYAEKNTIINIMMYNL